MVLYCVLNAFRARCNKGANLILAKLKASLFYDGFIRYIIEGNLKLTYENISFLALGASVATSEEKQSTMPRIAFVVIIAFWLIFSLAFPLKYRERLQDKEMIAKYGAMYDSIKTNSMWPATYTFVFCLRRFLLVLTSIFLANPDRPWVMLYALLALFTVNFAYLTNAKANEEKVMNWTEYINEICLIGLLYTMLFFDRTNQLDADVVWDAGTGTIALLAFCFFINFAYLLMNSIRKMI